MPTHTDDENNGLYIGCFHKTLPHADNGQVDAGAYETFKDLCQTLDNALNSTGKKGCSCKDIFKKAGIDRNDFVSQFEAIMKGTEGAAAFVNPLSAAACETHGPRPVDLDMPPAPSINSASAAAEMIELYWMALLRDVPLVDLENEAQAQGAIDEIRKAYQQALDEDQSAAKLTLGGDLPQDEDGQLDINARTLFGCGLPDEHFGPRISQFFLQTVPYGAQQIDTRVVPYIADKEFLTKHPDWLRAQNAGSDNFGNAYGSCNDFRVQLAGGEIYYPTDLAQRHISTMRDQARFVNRDALHQAYFNAALYLDAVKAPVDPGNPYAAYKRMEPFGTLGGPDLLTLVSEVASRALKVVWRQKWLVHRRGRPEVMGGLIQHRPAGFNLHDMLCDSEALQRVQQKYNTTYLPMAFSAGSPNHPAYGAGHASVAGACATILKAWFDDTAKLHCVIRPNNLLRDPSNITGILQPGKRIEGEAFTPPEGYQEDDLCEMTVGGEINKLASNVAMGRSMGGVHWRSDNTRSLRLGEQVAIHILQKRCQEYFEPSTCFTFTNFDGVRIKVCADGVAEA